MLKEAYDKATDMDTINGLKASNNPEFYQRIYKTYDALSQRQEAIKPLLPLSVNSRKIDFKFNNYTAKRAEARDNVSDYFYEKGLALLEFEDKLKIREACHTLAYIEKINPNYKQTRELMQEVHLRGIYYVMVSIENQTNQIIPRQLEDALLDFNTNGLNQFWTEYHAYTDDTIKYDYAMQLQLALINISPEQVRECEIEREKSIRDGWQYQLDGRGNVMKDSLGNEIKEHKFINVKVLLFELNQFKKAQITANVVFSDINARQTLEQFPIHSGFIFENFYTTFRVDRRALTAEDLDLIGGQALTFPADEQMIFDAGEDLKLRLKNIIANYGL